MLDRERSCWLERRDCPRLGRLLADLFFLERTANICTSIRACIYADLAYVRLEPKRFIAQRTAHLCARFLIDVRIVLFAWCRFESAYGIGGTIENAFHASFAPREEGLFAAFYRGICVDGGEEHRRSEVLRDNKPVLSDPANGSTRGYPLHGAPGSLRLRDPIEIRARFILERLGSIPDALDRFDDQVGEFVQLILKLDDLSMILRRGPLRDVLDDLGAKRSSKSDSAGKPAFVLELGIVEVSESDHDSRALSFHRELVGERDDPVVQRLHGEITFSKNM